MRHDATFKGFYAALALFAAGALFFFVLHVGGKAYRHHLEIQPQLADWSTGRIIRELGEYTQKIDCGQIGVSGLTGYVYVDQAHRRIIFVCK